MENFAMKEQKKCLAVNLSLEQFEQLKKVKEESGLSQNELLAQSIRLGLKSFEQSDSELFWVKVRIDADKMMELGQKLQSGELATHMIKFTYCLKTDPAVGISLWEAKNQKEFDALFTPHAKFYKEIIDISPAVRPEQAMALIMQEME
jgi:hypothetical protein